VRLDGPGEVPSIEGERLDREVDPRDGLAEQDHPEEGGLGVGLKLLEEEPAAGGRRR
jgi:hypothetical protein